MGWKNEQILPILFKKTSLQPLSLVAFQSTILLHDCKARTQGTRVEQARAELGRAGRRRHGQAERQVLLPLAGAHGTLASSSRAGQKPRQRPGCGLSFLEPVTVKTVHFLLAKLRSFQPSFYLLSLWRFILHFLKDVSILGLSAYKCG